MLENPPQNIIAFDVNVNYVQPYSRTTDANDVKISKLSAGTTAILNIGYVAHTPHIAGVTIRRKKPNANDVKKKCRSFVSEST